VPLYEVINFSVIDDWGQQVQLSVDYVFKTDFPGDEYISARPLSDTLDLGYFRSDSALLELGPNSAVINISYGFAGVPTPDRVTTDQIQFFMYVEGFEFYAEAFDYEKIWSIPTYP
jgi:hypothetical protein